MNRLHHNDRLIIRYFSDVWIILLVILSIILGILLFSYISSCWQSNLNYPQGCNPLSTITIVGFVFLFIIVIIILRPAIYIFDRITGELTILHRRLFGKQIERYPMVNIKAIELHTIYSQHTDYPGTYYIAILLMSGNDTKGSPNAKRLIISGTLGKKRSKARADMLASFLNLIVLEKITGL